MIPKLKICGITTLEDARFCAAAGVDYIGFVMHAESPRYIGTQVARDIREWIVGPLTVGVFVDQHPNTINQLADTIGLDLVQLHGSETPEDCKRINRPVIKAIGVTPDASRESLRDEANRFAGVAKHLLFDTRIGNRYGGTGTAFDWAMIAEVTSTHDIFLAGGISARNVQKAIQMTDPFAIDVSSGVEEYPGKKDLERISSLIQALQTVRKSAP